MLIWRRSYDVPPPGGESLKDTLARALPYYVQEILPGVLRGERTLVAAHGNSLRALIMVLEKLSPEQIVKRELATGVPVIYRLNADSTVASKLDLAVVRTARREGPSKAQACPPLKDRGQMVGTRFGLTHPTKWQCTAARPVPLPSRASPVSA